MESGNKDDAGDILSRRKEFKIEHLFFCIRAQVNLGRRHVGELRLIRKLWEADPLRCPKCSREMRIASLIEQEERILRHPGLWQEGVRVHSGTDTAGETTLDPWLDDPCPTTTPKPSWRFPPAETRQRPSAPLAPLVQRPPASGRRVARAPQPKKPVCLTSRSTFVTLRPWKPNFLSVKAISYQCKSNLLSI